MPFETGSDFYYGVNIAWLMNSFGWDLAPNQAYKDKLGWGGKANYDEKLINGFFRHIAHRKLKVIRYWVFEDLEGIKYEEKDIEISNTKTKKHPIITGINYELKKKVEDIMKKAREHNLEIYWCILNSWPADKNKRKAKPTIDTITRDIVANKTYLDDDTRTDCKQRELFINLVLNPFLMWLEDYKDAVFAIDLINEPEGSKVKMVNKDKPDHDILGYIKDASQAVKAEGFQCSVGFKELNTIIKYDDKLKDHLDFYDFHIYHYNGEIYYKKKKKKRTLKKYDDLKLKRPCIIGECGFDCIRIKEDPVSMKIGTNWVLQKEAVQAFLKNAKSKGFAGCLIWRYSPVGDRHRILKLEASDWLTDRGSNPEESVLKKFRTSFLLAAGSGIDKTKMDNKNWKEKHERGVWKAIAEEVE